MLNYPSGDLSNLVTSARTLLSSLQLVELGESGKGIFYHIILRMDFNHQNKVIFVVFFQIPTQASTISMGYEICHANFTSTELLNNATKRYLAQVMTPAQTSLVYP